MPVKGYIMVLHCVMLPDSVPQDYAIVNMYKCSQDGIMKLYMLTAHDRKLIQSNHTLQFVTLVTIY